MTIHQVCVCPDYNQKKPFRFLNFWCQYDKLLEIVKKEWREQVHGCAMYRVVYELKRIKLALREIKRKGWNDIETAAGIAKAKLMEVQTALHLNPRDVNLCSAEKVAQEQYGQAKKMVYSILQQQAKLTWLKCGDENSKVFLSSYQG